QPTTIANNAFQIITIPSDYINDRGELVIRMLNDKLPGSIVIETGKKGMELLYTVGAFEPNFIRSLSIIWVRLVFLAMIGLASGTFLGFPVACLLSMVTFCAAEFSHFIGEAIGSMTMGTAPEGGVSADMSWTIFTTRVKGGEIFSAAKVIIGYFDYFLVHILGAYAQYDPIPLLTDGRNVSSEMVMEAWLYVGLGWTAIAALVGVIIFYRRELARVTV
ncbi:MAG: hypothetical protein NTW19_02020, partial [Planctomycetota bacterium]|nr:hypothetical protein [Planctomycetota bacterium]